MNPVIETVIVIAVIALAAAFIAVRIVTTMRSKRPSCCAGKPGVPVKKGGAACPHCAAESNTSP